VSPSPSIGDNTTPGIWQSILGLFTFLECSSCAEPHRILWQSGVEVKLKYNIPLSARTSTDDEQIGFKFIFQSNFKAIQYEFKRCSKIQNYTGCSFCRLIRRPEHLISKQWYLPTNWRPFIRWSLISESVSVMPLSVTKASIVLCSVSLWLMWVNVQSACALNTRYIYIYESVSLVNINCRNLPLFLFRHAQKSPSPVSTEN
jgi:hypothetical protein